MALSRPRVALLSRLKWLDERMEAVENSGGTGGPHVHLVSDITGLAAALDGKQAEGDYAALSHDHDEAYSSIDHDHDGYALIDHDHTGIYQPAGSYAASVHGHAVADVTGLQAELDGKQASGSYSLTSHNHSGVYAPVSHSHVIADITGLQTALDGKQASGSYLTGITSGNVTTALGYTPTSVTGLTGTQSVAAFKTGLSLVKADVGLGSVDNTADAAKAVLTATKLFTARNINGTAFDGSANITINAVDSTARAAAATTISTTAPLTGGGDLSANRTFAISSATAGAAGSMSAADKTKLDAIASAATANSADATLLARANHTGTQTLDTTTDSATRLAMTSAERTKLSGIATSATANSTDAALSAAYRTLLDSSGSHIAAKVAGTYGLGQGDPLAVSGTGTLYPLNVIYIDAADYPAIGALAAKLRVRCIIEANDVAPTGNFTIGLHAVTRPGTSGGAGLVIYTMAAAIAGSTATQNTPAADSQNIITGADFAVPATGFYVLGVVTTGTIATSAHVHISAQLQMRYA